MGQLKITFHELSSAQYIIYLQLLRDAEFIYFRLLEVSTLSPEKVIQTETVQYCRWARLRGFPLNWRTSAYRLRKALYILLLVLP